MHRLFVIDYIQMGESSSFSLVCPFLAKSRKAGIVFRFSFSMKTACLSASRPLSALSAYYVIDYKTILHRRKIVRQAPKFFFCPINKEPQAVWLGICLIPPPSSLPRRYDKANGLNGESGRIPLRHLPPFLLRRRIQGHLSKAP